MPEPRAPVHEDETRGRHLLLELIDCDVNVLDDASRLEEVLRGAAEAAGATVISAAFHRFMPQGVTGVLLLKESHISIHTWPERRYAAVDLFTCGAGALDRAEEHLRLALSARTSERLVLLRGFRADQGSSETAD